MGGLHQLSSAQIDRNRDGETDLIYKYDLGGLISTAQLDSDFDGRYETRCRYKQGNTNSYRADVDGDGFYEIRETYKHGVIESTSMFDPKSERIKKKQFFEGDSLKSSDIDLDGNGQLETHYEYDEYEQIKN